MNAYSGRNTHQWMLVRMPRESTLSSAEHKNALRNIVAAYEQMSIEAVWLVQFDCIISRRE